MSGEVVHQGSNPGTAQFIWYQKDGMLVAVEDGKVWLSLADGALSRPSAGSVVACLKDIGVEDYDGNAVSGFAQGKSDRVLLGTMSSNPRDGVIEVKLAKDSSSAEIVLSRPVFGGRFSTYEDVLTALSKKGITHGICKESIQQACQDGAFDISVEAAVWTAPEHGRDASIDIVAATSADKRPVEDEHGGVNLRNLGVVNSVVSGQVLAVKTPSTEGVDGVNVRGIPVKAKNGKDKPFPSGSGTKESEDRLQLLAAIDGHLVEVNGRLHVLPIFQVEGDVDYSVGNIDFSGAVVVNGAVRDGFTIRAESDITVNGMVEGAFLNAGGNVFVTGGIRGTGKGSIEARKNISAGFADQAVISAGGDIEIKNALFHSDVRCAGKVIVLGGQKSQVAGGKIQAGQELVCLTLGSEMGTKTDVIVGVLAEQTERKLEIEKQLDKDEDSLKKIETNIAFLKKLEASGQMTPDKRKLLLEFIRASFTLKGGVKEKQNEAAILEDVIERNRTKGAVRVKGVCYPGVNITIRGTTYKVREQQRFCSFKYEDGEIKVRPFDG